MNNAKPKTVVKTLILFSLVLFIAASAGQAKEAADIQQLTNSILKSDSQKEIRACLEELSQYYFARNQYNECADYLNSLAKKKKSIEPALAYYIAFCRYQQMKYLEKNQLWDEYFSKGNAYRDDIVNKAEVCIKNTPATDSLRIYARSLLWRFHKDQEDAFAEEALAELIKDVYNYAQVPGDIAPIKDIALQLAAYRENTQANKLNSLYVDKLKSSVSDNEQLVKSAAEFYKQDSLELAESVYAAAIENLSKSSDKEKLYSLLVAIAREFAYKDGLPNDPHYAEGIFKQIVALKGEGGLDEELIYLRAYNLEKARFYLEAVNCYKQLAEKFPAAVYADEANFKTAYISAYALQDISQARQYFDKLSNASVVTPQAASAIYQLGLLSHWEGDNVRAKEYYDTAIQKCGNSFPETAKLALARKKEIENSQPIEYNLKTFLDISLRPSAQSAGGSSVGLESQPSRTAVNKEVKVTSQVNLAPTGCIPVDISYLWSGQTGSANAAPVPAFITKYNHSGTKEIQVVVTTASGIIGSAFEMVDVN